MTTNDDQCEQNAKQVLSALPATLGFQLERISSGLYELHSENCIVRLAFQRFEPSRCNTEFVNPNYPSNVMAYWVLRHLRCVPVTEDEKSSFAVFGQKLAHNFSDVLSGDFAIQASYDELNERIMDRVFEVRALPSHHPTRIRFENHDLQWLFDLEESD